MLAQASTTLLPLKLYATLPFWPLLGAIVVGLMIALRARAERAWWPIVATVAVSALLAMVFVFDAGRITAHESGGEAHATAAQHAVGETSREVAHAGEGSATGGEWTPEPARVPGKTITLFRWISLGERTSLQGGQWIAATFYFDSLTGVMIGFVTFVSLMVVIYSIGYMRDHHGHPERGYERFFAFLGLFVFSMATLVFAGNFVLLYLGWELVGLCSYLLIGFYYPKPSAAAAAKKAFIVNRIGDFGFALGIFSIYLFVKPLTHAGENPLDYAVVFHYIHQLAPGQITTIGLLLLCGALGKSAQFPLYVWLPDAMEGPSPVSALIHAATMVTAGVYMIARCSPIFAASQAVLNVIVVLGVIGAVMAATMAMAQFDMKRILAYSTISQLAYMFVALGCGAPDSGIFHVYTHAFFKALLFLGAGSVMHQMGHVIDLRKFSGLGRILPHTRNTMLVGCLALAGFPLLAGFWSKDEIVHASFQYHPAVGVLMLATAAMTAYYTFRMYFLCFHGPTRLPDEAGEHPHESPRVMTIPLYVLAVGAALAGYLGVTVAGGAHSFLGFLRPHGLLHHYLHGSTIIVDENAHAGGGLWLMYLSALLAIGGIAAAWLRYGTAPRVDPDSITLGRLWSIWNAKYYVDEFYDRAFVRPLRGLGRLCFAIDRNGIDGLIWVVTAVPRGLGAGLRLIQNGAMQTYALGMAIGVTALVLIWRWMEAAGG